MKRCEKIETDIEIYYFNTILDSINKLIERGNSLIDTKRIRNYLKIKSSDRSKINFIWRSLEYLEKEDYLELYSNTHSKIYKLPKEKIKIEK